MDNSPEKQASAAVPSVASVNSSPLPPQVPINPPVQKSEMKRNMIVVFAIIAIVLVVGGIFYFYTLKSPKTYNASMYTPPKTATADLSPTPTPEEPSINKNDNSNNALDSDSDIINKNINNAGTDLDGVNESFNDQQTNLQ